MSNIITVTIKTEYASGGRKSWWKHVKSIDAAQRGGYAFDGDFLKDGEVELPEGALLLHVTNCGSVKHAYQDGALFAVQADGSLREIVAGLNWREQSVTLRKAAEAYLAEPRPAEAGLIQPEATDLAVMSQADERALRRAAGMQNVSMPHGGAGMANAYQPEAARPGASVAQAVDWAVVGPKLAEAGRVLMQQYDVVDDFVMGGALTNKPFMMMREALALLPSA